MQLRTGLALPSTFLYERDEGSVELEAHESKTKNKPELFTYIFNFDNLTKQIACHDRLREAEKTFGC